MGGLFVDRASIRVHAGNGGNGSVSFRREKFVRKGGPDGGDGGRGGSVILEVTDDLQSLEPFRFMPHYEAKNGGRGSGQQCHGRNGQDIVLKVPRGTLVKDLNREGALIADLTEPGTRFVLAKGGRGGRGNIHFASATHQTPRRAEEGKLGEEFELELELKLVAQVGLVGFPNAGKSSILAAVSNAKPLIAPFPFSTTTPHVGQVVFDDEYRFTLADIPGLLEGAHRNVGLGHAFLRHIERTRVLLYVLDIAGTDGHLPWDDLKILKRELEKFQKGLSKRPAVVVANKMDEPAAEENLKILRKKCRLKIFPICALLGENIQPLVLHVRGLLEKLPPMPASIIVPPPPVAEEDEQ
jgi:GTPase